MKIRWLNTLLVTAAVMGGVLAYRAGKEQRQLAAQYARLASEVGHLPIEDPAKVYVRALETGEEMHFAWRIYFPANYRVQWQNSGGSSSSSWSSNPREFIARVRICEDVKGRLVVYHKQGMGSSTLALGDRGVADLLRDRWDEVYVDRLGAETMVAVEPNEVATLLRLKLLDDLQQQARQELNDPFRKRFETDLLSIRFGSQKAFQDDAEGAHGNEE